MATKKKAEAVKRSIKKVKRIPSLHRCSKCRGRHRPRARHHATVEIVPDIHVDKLIAPVVIELLRLGCSTLTSCQGTPTDKVTGEAYVMIDRRNAEWLSETLAQVQQVRRDPRVFDRPLDDGRFTDAFRFATAAIPEVAGVLALASRRAPHQGPLLPW